MLSHYTLLVYDSPMDEELSYRRRILILYGVGVALNAWFVWELLKETPRGRGVIEKIQSPFKKFMVEKDFALHGQNIVDEVELFLKGKNV